MKRRGRMKGGLREFRKAMRDLGAQEVGATGGHVKFRIGARVIPVPQGVQPRTREFFNVLSTIAGTTGIPRQKVRTAFGLRTY